MLNQFIQATSATGLEMKNKQTQWSSHGKKQMGRD